MCLFGVTESWLATNPAAVAEIDVQRQRRTGAQESDSDVERETSSSTNTFSAQEASESSTSGGSEASSDEGEPGSCCQERLLFEFLESEPPYQREPLADKACLLTETHLVHHSHTRLSSHFCLSECLSDEVGLHARCRFVASPSGFRSSKLSGAAICRRPAGSPLHGMVVLDHSTLVRYLSHGFLFKVLDVEWLLRIQKPICC